MVGMSEKYWTGKAVPKSVFKYLCRDEMGEWLSVKFIANSGNTETVAKAERICIYMAKNVSSTYINK